MEVYAGKYDRFARAALKASSTANYPWLANYQGMQRSFIHNGSHNQAIADPHNLIERFVKTQAAYQDLALSELRDGRKKSHWSWFIFPTPPYMEGGIEAGSHTNMYYALRTREQAEAYLKLPPQDLSQCSGLQQGAKEPVHLRSNYITLMETVAEQLEKNEEMRVEELIGSVDVNKLESSLIYFRHVADTMEPRDQGIVEVCDRALDAMAVADRRPGPFMRWWKKTWENGHTETEA